MIKFLFLFSIIFFGSLHPIESGIAVHNLANYAMAVNRKKRGDKAPEMPSITDFGAYRMPVGDYKIVIEQK
uniref:Uncharacterized protein n=1 Tax=Globodera rostochiensis TaxID=31243 RepID=A0A914I0F6_GLORO